ncbi:hypothetical protein [uncultured Sphingomonas sp.]|uniref:hypothetical protein n=1 Tax=uncultured Sphingomonas sp. TaxID=158754 RepID=UPI0035CBA4B8
MIDTLDLALERMDGISGEVRVSTSTLLPSGALATVAVRPKPGGDFTVSDEGSGRDDLLALGVHDLSSSDTQRANAIAARFGLSFEEQVFFARDVSAPQLAGAIAFVAEAAREWSSRTAVKAAQRTEAAIADRVERRLREIAPTLQLRRDREVVGGSGKRHRFDLVATLSDARLAVFEVLSPNTNALSSTYMKLADLRQANDDWPREVVTERLDAWSSEDLVLLSDVATKVRDLSHDWRDVGLLAA